MIQGQLVCTQNVVAADKAIRYLQARPKLEMVGLGLLYGKPGLGKTTYTQRNAILHGYVYLLLEACLRAKSFAVQLLTALQAKLGEQMMPHGCTNTLFRRILALLEDHPETVIIIDEIDYAFNQPELLGFLRDIVDETLAIVVLVGMQNARAKLLQVNAYYFDRCNAFYEFQPLSKADARLLCQNVLEINHKADIIDYVHFNACGSLRKAVKLLHTIEQVAKAKNRTEISVTDLC